MHSEIWRLYGVGNYLQSLISQSTYELYGVGNYLQSLISQST